MYLHEIYIKVWEDVERVFFMKLKSFIPRHFIQLQEKICKYSFLRIKVSQIEWMQSSENDFFCEIFKLIMIQRIVKLSEWTFVAIKWDATSVISLINKWILFSWVLHQ